MCHALLERRHYQRCALLAAAHCYASRLAHAENGYMSPVAHWGDIDYFEVILGHDACDSERAYFILVLERLIQAHYAAQAA